MQNLNNAPEPESVMTRVFPATFTGELPTWDSGVKAQTGGIMEDYELRLDQAIAGIMESDRKIKEIDAKINARVEEIKRTGVINLGDLGLLRRML